MPTNIVKTKTDERHWKKAKEIASKEKPDLTGDDYYAYTMGVYKKMSKKASNDDIIESLFEEGVLSKEAKDYYFEEKEYQDVLELLGNNKEAADSKSAGKFPSVWKQMGTGALYGAGLTAAGLGVVHGIKALSRLRSKHLRSKRLQEIKKFNPTIKDMDPRLVNATMKDIERLNPDYAASPLISGDVLKGVQNWGGFGVDQANLIRDEKGPEMVSRLFTGKQPRIEKKGSFTEKLAGPKMNRAKTWAMEAFHNKDFQGAAATLGTLAGILGAVHFGKKIKTSLTRKKRIREMKKWYPILNNYSDDIIEDALKSVEKINPGFGNNPFVAGGYVKDILFKKTFGPKLSQGLAEARGNVSDASTLAERLMGM